MKVESKAGPSFVGYWMSREGTIGVFEYFLFERKKDSFSGRIMDIYGNATFNGHIQPNGDIYFEKVYEKDMKNGKALNETICFRGKRKNGGYAGKYFSNNNVDQGSFVLERPGNSPTLDFLIQRLIEKEQEL